MTLRVDLLTSPICLESGHLWQWGRPRDWGRYWAWAVLGWSVVRGASWLHEVGEGQVQRMKPLIPN